MNQAFFDGNSLVHDLRVESGFERDFPKPRSSLTHDDNEPDLFEGGGRLHIFVNVYIYISSVNH